MALASDTEAFTSAQWMKDITTNTLRNDPLTKATMNTTSRNVATDMVAGVVLADTVDMVMVDGASADEAGAHGADMATKHRSSKPIPIFIPPF